MSGNNILITGITGFIGSHLAQHLSNNKDNNIYGLYRSVKHESVFNALKLQERKNINLILGNIMLYPDLEELLVQYNIDTIYHLAAKVIVKDSAKSPTTTYLTNINGTINILEVVRNLSNQYNKPINVYVMSSDKAYGTNKIPYKEKWSLNGIDIYSSSKACEDIIARAYAYNYDLPIVVGRPCNCYGLDFNWSRLIPTLARACLSHNRDYKEKPIQLNKGSYHYLREYIYVEDLVRIMELLIQNIDKTKGEAYNITSSTDINKNIFNTEYIVKLFFDICNIKKEINFMEKESTFKEIENQYLDKTKLVNILGDKLCSQYTVREGMKKTINLYKEWFENGILSNYSTHEADSYLQI